VQRYSDQELFWILKNGIRLSGMPGFGRTESDEHIWTIVLYVRSLVSQELVTKMAAAVRVTAWKQ
jgi:mono/diheme cytochrome c family protein